MNIFQISLFQEPLTLLYVQWKHLHMQQNDKYIANMNLQCSLFHWTLALKPHTQFHQ